MQTYRNDQNPVRIALIGECMIELRKGADGAIQQGFGGDSLNTAVYVARLSQPHQIESYFVTALGEDTFSDQMVASWQQERVNCEFVARLPAKLPGMYSIQVDETGERTFYYWRNEAAAKELMRFDGSDKLVAALEDFDVIYVSGISFAILAEDCRARLLGALANARARGAKVVFDSNYRPRLWSSAEETKACYAQVMQQCDIALLTLDDEELLYGDTDAQQTLQRTHGFGVTEVLLKRGAEDCLVSMQGQQTSVPAMVVTNVVDTTSAGDSFNGGYLAARFSGASAIEAAQLGHRTASTVIQYPGALIPKTATDALIN